MQSYFFQHLWFKANIHIEQIIFTSSLLASQTDKSDSSET